MSLLASLAQLPLAPGFSACSDFDRSEWKSAFQELEPIQHEVLQLEPHFRSPKHTWGSTPLYHWSRVWEYPMVFSVLRAMQAMQTQPLRVLDFGSSVTFFDVALAREGMQIIASDIDPLCQEEIERLLPRITTGSGHIEFTLLNDGDIPLPSASLDAVISISVFEHIVEHGGKWRECLQEIHRVLKPQGIFLLTIDVGADDHHVLTPAQYRDVRSAIDELFVCAPARNIPPYDRLNTFTGPHPLFRNQWHYHAKRLTKWAKSLLGIPSMKLYQLTCEAILAEKR